jgi:hypothetical protein
MILDFTGKDGRIVNIWQLCGTWKIQNVTTPTWNAAVIL